MSSTFDRTFRDGDEFLFADLTAGMLGQPCVAWRKSYGRSGSLHLGSLSPRIAPPALAVHKEQGTWIVDLWGCDRRLVFPTKTFDNRLGGDDVIISHIPGLEGRTVERIDLNPDNLSLTLEFSDSAVLDLITSAASNGEDEQWAIQLPDRLAIVAYGSARWALEQQTR